MLRTQNISAPATLRVMSISHSLSPHVQAEIMEDMQLFGLFLPHLTFFLDVAKRCGFMSEELKDSMSVGQPEFLESWN